MSSTLSFPTNRNHQRSLSLSTSLLALSALSIPVASTIATKLRLENRRYGSLICPNAFNDD
ncbi:hypothetical protein ACE6H2_023855 [Prunus campanulata]